MGADRWGGEGGKMGRGIGGIAAVHGTLSPQAKPVADQLQASGHYSPVGACLLELSQFKRTG